MPPKFMLPQALLDDAEQIRRVVEEDIQVDTGETQPADCLSPDSIDQVALIESKDHASQVRDISVALVREFLGAHRRELRGTMETFEAAVPRDNRGLTKRSAIARLVKIDSSASSDNTLTTGGDHQLTGSPLNNSSTKLSNTTSSAAFDELEAPPSVSILERLVSAVLNRGLAPVGVIPVGQDRHQLSGGDGNGNDDFDDLLNNGGVDRNPSLNFGFNNDGVEINGFSVGSTCALNGGQFSVTSLSDLSREDAVVIGQGAGGRVLRMRHKNTDDYYAVKEIVVGSANTINEIKKEISVLWGTCRNHDDLPSPFLITCHGIFYEHGMLYIVMDLMACSLKDALDTHGPFAENYLRAMFYQVLHGLHYLHHTKKQLHRDIKPHNILISDMGSVKISDFGIASERVQTLHHNARQTFCGTLSYMSPGRAEGLPYSFEADLWGVGMSLFQLAVGELPEGSRSVFAIAEFRQNPPRLPQNLPERYSKDFQDFVAVCLQPEISKPITVKDLLHHPWMRGMTLERSQRLSADVARDIVHMMQQRHQHGYGGDGENDSEEGNGYYDEDGNYYEEDKLDILDQAIADSNL